MYKNKTAYSRFSDIKVRNKFLILNICGLAVSFILGTAVMLEIYSSKTEKYSAEENSMLTASQQLMEMAIESSVSIARNIYANESLYRFLDTEYSSVSDYYDAYYEIQHNSPTAIAEANIIKNYTIYTENETIPSGGDISSLSSEKNSDWYKTYKRLNKAMLLYCNPDIKSFSLIRKLDYNKLATGEAYLKMDLNIVLLKSYFDNLDFYGELYIISGDTLIYSNYPGVEFREIEIDRDFAGYTENCYSANIEYYAKARNKGIRNIFLDNWYIPAVIVLIMTGMFIISRCFSDNIRRRISDVTEEYSNKGAVSKFANSGKDEIGGLIDICSELSEKIVLTNSENQQRKESLKEWNMDYDTLFRIAMRQDAELAMQEKYPDVCLDSYKEDLPVFEEVQIIIKIAQKFSRKTINIEIPPDIPENITVPAFSLAMIAENIFKSDGNHSLKVECDENSAELLFESYIVPSAAKILKLNAIFEDNNISGEYSFDHNYEYNPYLRIKHCLGSRVDMELKRDKTLTFKIIIKRAVV